MNVKTVLQSIEDKDMDRKDFLKYAGLLVLGIVGSRTFIGMLLPDNVQVKRTVESVESRGFGRSKYGA